MTRQDSAGSTAGTQLSEPPLHRLRWSLVGTRYEVLKTAAFSVAFIISLCMIAGGAGLLSPDNQFYEDARVAMNGFAANAQSEAGMAAAHIQVAANSAAHGVADRVSSAIPALNPASAPAVHADLPAHAAAPAVAPHHKHLGHVAGAAVSMRHRLARHRHHETAPPAPAPQTAEAWSPGSIPGSVSNEFAKVYYGVVNFVAHALPSTGNSASGALDSFTHAVGMDSQAASFDPSHPETVIEILTSTSTLVMLLGCVLFAIIAGVFVMSVKDSLRSASRRLRTRRSGGYA